MAAIAAVMSFAQTPLTPPSNIIEETWYFDGTMGYQGENGQSVSEEVTEPVTVGFIGDEIYIKFPNPLFGSSWIKGTQDSDGNYVFANGQYLGNYYGENVYFCGTNDAQTLSDVTFYYNETTETLTCYSYILMNGNTSSLSAWCYFYPVTITKDEVVPETPVEAPEGLVTQDYQFKASSLLYDNEGNYTGSEPVSYLVKVGFSGNNVYIQGLCEDLPEAWVKGTLNDDEVTFENGQFLDKAPMNVYMCGRFMNEMSDLVFIYDQATGSFDSRSYYLVINSSKTEFSPYYVFAGVTLTKFVETAATPAAPSVTRYQPYNNAEGYGYIGLNIPTISTDGTVLNTEKLSYKIYLNNEQTPYVFKKPAYEKIEGNMEDIPYNYSDNYDINSKGEPGFFFFSDIAAATRIGVQSIYKGAGKVKTSDITWYTPDSNGITELDAQEDEVTYYNLRGQQVDESAKGILIQKVRKADGSIKTRKVMKN